jgi:PAS domain S-box-containing protein
MVRAVLPSASEWRPRVLRAAIFVVAILTISSTSLIIVAIRQQQLMEQRVRFFFQMETLEQMVGALHTIADQGSAGDGDVVRLSAEADRQIEHITANSDLFGTIQPRIVNQLNHVHRALAWSGGSPPPGRLYAITNDAFTRIHLVQDIAGGFFTDRMRRYGVLTGSLAALLAGACALLSALLFVSGRSARLIDRLDHDLHALMESAPLVMLTVSRRGTVRLWNERLARLTATRAERPLTELFAREHWPALHIALEHARACGESECDLPLLLHDGQSTEMAWIFYARDAEVTMTGRDVSDRAAAQRELVRAGARYAELFEQIRDAALITENGRVVSINSAGLEKFGYSRDAMAGMPLVNLVANEADVPPFIHALRHGPVVDYELRLVTSDERTLDCLITAAARFDAEGTLVGCQGLARDVTEKKRMHDALRQSEHEYRSLFEHAHDAIVVIDRVTEEVLDANGQACIMYDFPREEFIGRSLTTLSVDPERGKRMLRKTHEGTGRYSSFESQQLRRDGTIMDVEIHAAEVPYRGRTAILSINRDVTARRAAERTVRESEERFRLLLESVTDYAIFMLDPDGKVVSWNEGAQRITGYTPDEILGRSTSILFPPEEAESAAAELQTAAQEGRAEVEGWRMRKDGSRFFAAVTVTRVVDENGALRGFAKITRDVTELKRYETTQQEIFTTVQNVAAEWTQTFDAVQVPIVLLGGKGEIRRLNRAAQRLANQRFQDLRHLAVSELPGEPWQTVSRLARYARDFGRSAESRAVDPDSGSVWQISSCVTNSPSAERFVTVVAYDLTLVTRLEESLRQTEIAATLGAIVGGVAHEVRNPLFTISATLDAWEARLGETPHLRRYMDPLREEVDRLNRLMRDLLEYGKPHPLAVQPAPLATPLAAAVSDCRAIAAERGVSIVTSIAEELPDLHIDGARMEQVFQNVIANAVQHSPKEGIVQVVVTAAGDAVVCSVTDEGPGLLPEEAERVFTPFYSRRRGGTGLGLSIAHKIVTAHHGQITIGNRAEVPGAVVTITLPTAAHSASSDSVGGRDAAAESTPRALGERGT